LRLEKGLWRLPEMHLLNLDGGTFCAHCLWAIGDLRVNAQALGLREANLGSGIIHLGNSISPEEGKLHFYTPLSMFIFLEDATDNITSF